MYRLLSPAGDAVRTGPEAFFDELAKATGQASARDLLIDAAAFTVAMRNANVDKEFSWRLFEFLDEGTVFSSLLKS
jgi:hypothetical protein